MSLEKEKIKISPLILKILQNRGVVDPAAVEKFLYPRLSSLCDPFDIPDMARAAERVIEARSKGEKVMVYGDYDVDGVTATVILLKVLKKIGVDAEYYIPHRYGEGYSLSEAAVRKICEAGIKLIITVDCGTANFAEIKLARELGGEVIVTDHHNLSETLPPAAAVVNPKRIEGEHPSKHLSGAGVAFKFGWALLRTAGEKDSVFLTSLLDLAALGTLSDVVPLTGENRVLSVVGLKQINERKRTGIKLLSQAAGLYGRIGVNQVYFALAPRLNAAGRLEHASRSVDLLLTENELEAKSMAEELNKINLRRQDIGASIKDEVFARIEEEGAAQQKIMVLEGREWHPGVIGIVASQAAESFYRPAVLIGVNDGVGRGSARSVEGVDIFKLLNSCRELFLDFGGHEGAAGFEIEADKIPELKRMLVETAASIISDEQLIPHFKIDAEITPAQITLSLVKEVEMLSPFGEGNPEPVFQIKNLKLTDYRLVGSQSKHLKTWFTDGKDNLEAIGFGLGSRFGQLDYTRTYDIAFNLESNEYNGFETVQLSLVEIKEANG